jgi:hypothetical protein
MKTNRLSEVAAACMAFIPTAHAVVSLPSEINSATTTIGLTNQATINKICERFHHIKHIHPKRSSRATTKKTFVIKKALVRRLPQTNE